LVFPDQRLSAFISGKSFGFGFSISAILAILAILAISSDQRSSAFISGKKFWFWLFNFGNSGNLFRSLL